ncbi:hypothetical protein ABT354_30450 [Streptomyces sp. NPDC000594]|uniref:hypothetical protein n=1 Tax=Streptomyces sp. NPDC000594 TaxID=3154261 RepID=UPI0033246013
MDFHDTAAVPGTNGWKAWLAYADQLTKAGDLRGEAIRLEHHGETRGGDPARAAEAYREVERRLGLDGLRADGSWEFTWSRGFIDEARFRLAADTRSDRGELVGRLPADHAHTATTDPADPERWEGALIDALLSHPAARRLRSLELHLTDYHHSAERAALSLAARERPRLEHLYFGYDFTYLFEHSEGSAGSRIQPLNHHDRGLVQTDIWGSLPALRSVEIEGAFLFHFVRLDGPARLRIRGSVISDGSLFGLGWTSGVESLEVEIGSDVFGCCPSIEQLDELTADQYPGLRRLDLSGAEFDAPVHEVLSVLADSSVLARLTEVRVGELVIEGEECGGDPSAALAGLASRYAHLDLYVDLLHVEGVEDEEVARILAGFGPKGIRVGE